MTQAIGNFFAQNLANGLTAAASRAQASPRLGCAIATGIAVSTAYCAWQTVRGAYQVATSPTTISLVQNVVQIGSIGVVAIGLAKANGSQEALKTGITAGVAALIVKSMPAIALFAYNHLQPLTPPGVVAAIPPGIQQRFAQYVGGANSGPVNVVVQAPPAAPAPQPIFVQAPAAPVPVGVRPVDGMDIAEAARIMRELGLNFDRVPGARPLRLQG